MMEKRKDNERDNQKKSETLFSWTSWPYFVDFGKIKQSKVISILLTLTVTQLSDND